MKHHGEVGADFFADNESAWDFAIWDHELIKEWVCCYLAERGHSCAFGYLDDDGFVWGESDHIYSALGESALHRWDGWRF